MKIVYEPKAEIAEWLLGRIDYVEAWPDDCQVIAVKDGDEILGACVFEKWTGHDIDMSIAIKDPRCAVVLRKPLFRYAFRQLACRRMSAEVAAKNTDAIEKIERMGFSLEGRKRNAIPGDDLLQYGLLVSECRYL